ncbi:MAG: S26 family signal peptidase [Deltaproteobacteria bacterium]|jgi:signal peptidase I|nr:S26 family signal peptidase [Deltaproteobacteria bacterium]
MNDFILTDSLFCKLVKSIPADKTINHIKVQGHGSSMSPFLKNNETLFIKPVKKKTEIKTGDIIAVTDKNEEKIIVHRVISQKKNICLLKGDNCKKKDGWFTKKQVLGIITQKKKQSGKIICFFRWESILIAFLSKTGFLNSILLPFGRLLKIKLQRF